MQNGTISTPSPAGPAAPAAPASIANGGLALLTRVTDEITRNRPGIQTTEFTLVAGLFVGDIVLTALGKVPTSLTVVFGAFSAAAYQWLRNNRKDTREASLLNLIDTLLNVAPGLVERETGNGGRGDAASNPVSSGSSSSSSTSGFASARALALLALGSWFLALSLTGCQTLAKLQADPRVQFAEQEALKIGVAALQRYSNGGNFDSVWGISEGLYAMTDTISVITAQHPDNPNSALAVQLAQTIQSYASTGNTKALAGQIGAIITKANPQSDAQRVAVVNAIANSLQNAAKVSAKSQEPSNADGKATTPSATP